MYTRYLNRIRSNQGYVFISERWKQLSESGAVEIRSCEVRAQSSLEIGKRLYEPSRLIYIKITMNYGHVNKKEMMKIAVKARNETISENGLVTSPLVVGVISRLQIVSTELPKQKSRM